MSLVNIQFWIKGCAKLSCVLCVIFLSFLTHFSVAEVGGSQSEAIEEALRYYIEKLELQEVCFYSGPLIDFENIDAKIPVYPVEDSMVRWGRFRLKSNKKKVGSLLEVRWGKDPVLLEAWRGEGTDCYVEIVERSSVKHWGQTLAVELAATKNGWKARGIVVISPIE